LLGLAVVLLTVCACANRYDITSNKASVEQVYTEHQALVEKLSVDSPGGAYITEPLESNAPPVKSIDKAVDHVLDLATLLETHE
jgi:hypothetical protein